MCLLLGAVLVLSIFRFFTFFRALRLSLSHSGFCSLSHLAAFETEPTKHPTKEAHRSRLPTNRNPALRPNLPIINHEHETKDYFIEYEQNQTPSSTGFDHQENSQEKKREKTRETHTHVRGPFPLYFSLAALEITTQLQTTIITNNIQFSI